MNDFATKVSSAIDRVKVGGFVVSREDCGPFNYHFYYDDVYVTSVYFSFDPTTGNVIAYLDLDAVEYLDKDLVKRLAWCFSDVIISLPEGYHLTKDFDLIEG